MLYGGKAIQGKRQVRVAGRSAAKGKNGATIQECMWNKVGCVGLAKKK
jgi:hypothetical protein